VFYTKYHTDDYVNELQKHYNGLKNENAVEKLLQDQNFIEVLNHLWSEPSQVKRIAWLEKHQTDGLLLFELGLEYFLKDPTISTYVLKSLPLFEAGKVRVGLDTLCSEDKSVQSAPAHLEYVYINQVLSRLGEVESDIADFFEHHYEEFWIAKKKIIFQILEAFLDKKIIAGMPKPTWVFSHGLSAFRGYTINLSEHEDEWKQIRQENAKMFKQYVIEMDKEVMKNPKAYAKKLFSDWEYE